MELTYFQVELLLKSIGIREHNQVLQDAKTPHLDLKKLPKPMKWMREEDFKVTVTDTLRDKMISRWYKGAT